MLAESGLLNGSPNAYVSFFRYLFCDHDLTFTAYLVRKGFEILGKNSFRFE
ncbi:unnamed protein product [Protopolystoma xenopodis]|uniref:Centrosomal CEP44 domain-containing protein n=1 Tax=Protopolystoma xenopodis TaxID=117903 RepID=A0A448XET0_9PLAT|nr:unnamed protein product [Protopolystoma xenopodis]